MLKYQGQTKQKWINSFLNVWIKGLKYSWMMDFVEILSFLIFPPQHWKRTKIFFEMSVHESKMYTPPLPNKFLSTLVFSPWILILHVQFRYLPWEFYDIKISSRGVFRNLSRGGGGLNFFPFQGGSAPAGAWKPPEINRFQWSRGRGLAPIAWIHLWYRLFLYAIFLLKVAHTKD